MYTAFFQDITEQKEQQLLLERNGAFQQLIAETSASLINVTNENFDAKVDSILQRFGRFFQRRPQLSVPLQ